MELFQTITSSGMFPYTVLLGLMVLYWVVVIIGAIDIGILDFFDFGDLGEAAEGAAEGVEAAGEAAEGMDGVFSAILGFLSLGQVPVTVVLSLLILKLWFLALLMTLYLPASLRDVVPPLFLGAAGFVFAFIVSVMLTGLTARPLRRVFKRNPVRGHAHLVGQICKVKSSRVTEKFGQAELRVRNSFLLIEVRSKEEEELERGQEAVIVSYDHDRDVYHVRGV
ncbi:MAG: DUF1449 family protein [Lentisphaerae bacterium]|nr:DUF1449 family protein [Lentisphaerota bacterium]MBT4820829.1 DUF1449 family protein [Lentisphaerota bacterium]MBT5604725.1 DUF1449 family protein [Lentisphaerota bacterium]MBT7058101.1 DUF1449 family protein [Lentisphaerota bacterium]MBT7841789.1 DUF1449 family protein [Lentisphaerota bacterium]